MIDLSFLTEEEQEAIMKVLQRDAQLKKAEEDRVRVLEDTIDDTNELKNKTGQWFYEAKSKRHRDKIHGADLIRASIRKKKPLTIAELTQSRTDKTKKSWVNNVNKDLFVPPELVGVMEEPDREDEEEKTQGQLYRSAPKVDTLSFEEPPQSTIKGVSSPSKQRKKPFNDPTLEVGFELNTENHISENGSAHLYDLAEKDIMPSSQRSEHNEKMPKFEQNEDNQNFSDALDGLERKSEQKIPKPKVRTVTYKIADTQSDSDSSFSKPPKRNDSLNGTGTRKGILKRSPSSSSTDSEILRISQSLDSQSKTLSPNSPILEGEAVKNYLQNPPDQSSQSSIDRLKQVRFTSVDVPDTLPPTPDTHKGREIGEFDLLESDYAKNSKDDIDGVKPLYNEHESIQNSIYAHPERVDMDPDVAATASNEEDRDITLDASSNLCLNLKTEAPGPPQVPPTSLITTQPHQSSSEVLQEKRSLVDAASIKTSNHIFDNIRENEEPTSGTFPNRDSSDLSSLASQASTLSIDQQPVYAKINTPRLSKLDSSDKLQGKESIDESDPSRKTETMIMDNTKPNNDDKRDNFNVPQNANLLKFNTDVQESKDETFRTSKHFSGKFESAVNVGLPRITKSVERPELATHISKELQIEAKQPHDKNVTVGKSGWDRIDKTTDYLINRKEEQQSHLDVRSKEKVDNGYYYKHILKSPQQDDDEKVKHYKNRNVDDVRYPVTLYGKIVGDSSSDSLEQDGTANITWKGPQFLDNKETTVLHVVSTTNSSMELHQNGSCETAVLFNQSEHPPLPFENASHQQDIMRQDLPTDSMFYCTHNTPPEQETGDTVKKTCFSPEVPGLHQLIKEDPYSFKKASSADRKIHHKSAAKGQFIGEVAVKDIEEIVSKSEVPSRSNISEFNIALMKLESEANASLNSNRNKSSKGSSADQNVNSQPLLKNSGTSLSVVDEAEEVDTLKKSTLFQAQEEIQQSMECPVAEAVSQEVFEIIQRTVAPPNATLDEFDQKLERLHRDESAELYPRYQMHENVLQKPISACEKQNAPSYSKEPTEKTWPPAKYEAGEFTTELARENEGTTLPLLSKTQVQHSHLDSPNHEVKEAVVKTIALPKSDHDDFKLSLEKLHMELNDTSSAAQQTVNEVIKVEEKHDREHPNIPKYPTTEIVDQSIAQQNSELRKTKSQGEKLREQLKSPTHNKSPVEQGCLKYPKDKWVAEEVKEVIVRTAAPQKDTSLFHNGLQKLSTEASDSSLPMDFKPSEVVRMTIKQSEEFQRPPPVETIGRSVTQSNLKPVESKPNVAEVLRRCEQYPRKSKEKMSSRIREVKGHHTEVREVGLQSISPAKGDIDEFKCDSENIQNPVVQGSFPVLHTSSQNIEEKMFSPHKHPLEQAMVEEIMVKEKSSIAPKAYFSESPSGHPKIVSHASALQDPSEQAPLKVDEGFVKMFSPKGDVSDFNSLRNLAKEASLSSSSVHLTEVPMQKKFQENDSAKQIETTLQFSKDVAVETTIMSPNSELLEFKVEEEQHSESPRKNSLLIIKITDVQPNFEHGASNTSVNKLLNESSPLHNKMIREQMSISHLQEELLQEVQEVPEKVCVPTKPDVSAFKKGLEKLQKEASKPVQYSAVEIPRVASPLQNANEIRKSVSSKPVMEWNTNINKPMEVSPPLCDTALQEQISVRKPEEVEHPQEVTEVVLKTAVPTKTELNGFNIGLQKLCQEASEQLLPELQKSPGVIRSQEQCYIEGSKEDIGGKMAVSQTTSASTLVQHKLVLEEEKASKQLGEEVKEVIVKTVLPATDVSPFNLALNKMFIEDSQSFQVTQEGTVQTKKDDFSQRQADIAESTTAPQNSDLLAEKVQRDALPTLLVHKESYGMTNSLEINSECPQNEMRSPMGKTDVCPNSDCREYKTSVIKLLDNTPLQQQESINHSKVSEPPQEISENVVKTLIPIKNNLNEFKIGLIKLQQEASKSHVPESTAVSKSENMNSAQQHEYLIEVQKEECVGSREKPVVQQATDPNVLLTSPEAPLIPTLLVKQSAPEHLKEETALQEVKEVVFKTEKPEPDVRDFNKALKKLLTNTHLSPVQQEGRVHRFEEQLSTQQKQSPLACHTEETIERKTALPQNHVLEFKRRLEKLQKEALMSTSPGHEKAQKDLSAEEQSSEEYPSKEVVEIVRKQSSFKSTKEDMFPQKVTEVMTKTAVPPKSGLQDFKIGIEKLQKEALEPRPPVLEKASSMNRSHEKDFILEDKNIFECINDEVAENAGRRAGTTLAGNYKVDASPHCTLSAHRNDPLCSGGKVPLPKVKEVVRTAVVSSETNIDDCKSDISKVSVEASLSSSIYHGQPSKPDKMHKYFKLQKQRDLKITNDKRAEMACAPTKDELVQNTNLLPTSPKQPEFPQHVQNYADLTRKEISFVEKADAQPIIDSGELNQSVTRQPNELSSLMNRKALEDQRSLDLCKKELIPWGVSEVVVKTVAPTNNDSNVFKTGLQKLHNEASDPELIEAESPNIVVRVQGKYFSQQPPSFPGGPKEGIKKVENAAIPPVVDTSGLHARPNVYLQPKLQESPQENVHIQEVNEVIVKSISPKDDLCEFHKGLQKLVTEASLSSPALQVTDGQTKIKITKESSLKFPVEELVERTLAPTKAPVVDFKAAVEKLQIEALKPTSTGNPTAGQEIKLPKHLTIEKNHPYYPRKNIAEKGASKCNSELGTGLNKLNKESSPVHPKALEEQGSFKLCEDKKPFNEVREDIVKTTTPPKCVPNFKDKLQKLHKEMPDSLLPVPKTTSIVFRTEGKDSMHEPQGGDIIQKEDVVDNVNMACGLPAAKPVEGNSGHIVSLPHLFDSETTGLKDSFLTEPHVSNRMENSEIYVTNSVKKDTVPMNEVREHVEKTTVSTKKDLYKFVSGLHKLVEESSSPLQDTTFEQQRPLQSLKIGLSSEQVKEYNFRSLKLPSAGLTKYGRGREKVDINASTTNSLADQGSSSGAKVQQMLSKEKSYQTLKHHRNTSCNNTESDVSLKTQLETVLKTTVLPKSALGEFKTGLNTTNKEASPSSQGLRKNSNINADIYKGKIKHSQRGNQSGVYAGPVSEEIDNHAKLLTGDSKQDVGQSQSLQSKLSVKLKQSQYQDVDDHQEELPPPEVMKAFDETISNPKSAFPIGFEKVYNEFSEATLARADDQRNIVHNFPEVQQGRVNDQNKIPAMPITKIIKHGHQGYHQQETTLHQKVNKSVILSKIETSAFQDRHTKHCLDASDTFDKQADNLENTSENMSVQDQEKIDRTIDLGKINSSADKKGMLHSGRYDATKENTQILQNSSSLKQKYSDDLDGSQLLREATGNTVNASTAEQDQQPLHAEIKSPQVSKLSASDHQQGKPDHVEELNAKTSSKSDKYINEFKKAADESISKVLDWFNRDSEHSTTQANHNNSPKKIFIEESGPSPKTETRVIVSENTRSNADLGNQLPSTENAQWRGERLSFGNYKNGGGKSGDVDFPGKVDVETKTLDSKNVQQRVDDQLKSSSEEQLLFGKSRSGGGKICFESEHPRGEIQKANLFTTETVPKSYKENQENGDRRNINFSPDYIEEPKKENNPNYIFRDSMQIEDLSSPTKKDTEKPQENKANKPAILKQNTHMQQPDTEEKGLPTRIEIKSDIKSFWEGGKPMTKSSPTTHKFKENTRSYAIDTGLVKDPVSINSNVSLEKELQIEAQTPNVKDVRASWEKKGVQKSRPEQLKNETSDKHTKSTDLEQNVPGKIVSSYAEGLLQKKTNINYETINKHDSLSGIDRSLNSLQKPNFKVHSLKERISEGSADKVSNPEQFQSLRTFWETDKKSPVKPEIQTSFRSVPTLHDSKSSGSVELRANVNQNTHNSLQDQNKEVSDVDEKDLYIKEWYQKESQLIVVPKHEVVEAVEKVRAPSKSEDDSLKGSLQRLSQEASEMKDVAKPTAVKSAKPTSNDNALNSEEQNIGKKTPDTLSPNKATFPTSPTGETVPGQGSFYENVKKRSLNISDGQKTQTVQPKVSSTVLKTSKPRINDSFDVKTTLKKQLSEASKNSDPALTQQILLEQSPQEIQETIDKTAVPPKADVHEFRAGLQKLLEEESRIPPVASRNADKVQQSAFQPANENAFENANSTRLSDSYEIQNKVQDNRDEIHETVIKMAAPEKVEFSAFDSGLEKLYKEASEPSPKTTDAEENVNGSLSEREQPFLNKSGKNMHDSEKTFPGREEVSESEQSLFAPRMVVTAPGPLASQQTPFPPEVKETVDKIVLPNTDVAEFDASLEKLYQEALESPETDEVEHGQNFAFRPEEITLADLQVSRVDSFDTKVLIKKETLNQASLVEEKESMDKHVSLIKDPAFAEAPNRNVVFLHKKVHTSTPSENKQQPVGEDIDTVGKTEKGFEHPVNKEFEVKDLVNGRGYSPEVDIPDTFLRASTPVKEINRNVQNSTIDMVLSSQHEIKDDAKSMDSVLLDGNDGLYAEVRKKPSRSEEELSPVLAVLRRSSAKPVPSKSLEDLSSASSKEENVNFPREDFVRSNEYDQRADKQEAFYESISERPTGPSYPDNRFSDPEKVKRLSKSVPDFLQDESDDRETDSASEGSFQLGRHKKTPSSLTNLSGSSGMASLSSVSGSVMSIYSGDFGNVDIKGNIQFAIDYVDQLQEFHIFVAQCKELAVAEVKKNRSDPYVKSYLLPDKEKMGKRKTAVRKKTLNPAYNEILRYKISKQTLLTQKLNLSVWHNDMFGRNSFLGEVDIDLATWDWNNKQMNWFPLQPRTPAAGMGLEYRGEMTVALKHSTVPTSGKNAASNGEVYIWVKSCSNLPVLRGNRINSFVKCTVLPDTSRKSRQKTRTVDKTVNPVFNHTMVYDGFRAEDLREACVELTVWDHNRLSNHFLGGLRLGSGSGKSYGTPVDWMDSTSYETSLWKRMISSPDQWVEDTLQLRMLMMAKMTK